MLITFSLITFIYISWLCGHKTTAMQNTIMKAITTEDRFLYLLYFMTTYLHLLSIVLMFSNFKRGTVILALLMGVVSIIWHIVQLVLYFVANDNKTDMPIVDAM